MTRSLDRPLVPIDRSDTIAIHVYPDSRQRTNIASSMEAALSAASLQNQRLQNGIDGAASSCDTEYNDDQKDEKLCKASSTLVAVQGLVDARS